MPPSEVNRHTDHGPIARLTELSVENLAVVERVGLSLGTGLVTLTGETGVGKSIVVDALKLLTGGKARTDLIRAGTERAVVEGVFRRVPAAVLERLAAAGVMPQPEAEDELVIRRVVGNGGGAYINDRRVGIGLLAEVGAELVDIQGQHAARSLLSESTHGALLDALGGLARPVAAYRQQYDTLKSVLEEMARVETGRQEAEARAAFLRFALDEIDRVAPEPDVDEALGDELNRLAHAERLRDESRAAYDALYGADGALLERLAEVLGWVDGIAHFGADLADTRRMLADARLLLEEAAESLRHYRDEARPDPARQARVEQRLAELEGLKRKYGNSLEEVLATARAYDAELAQGGDVVARLADLAERRDTLFTALSALADDLHRAREVAAERLTAATHEGLAALGMPHARLTVVATPVGHGIPCGDPCDVSSDDPSSVPSGVRWLGPDGHSRHHFLLAANPGERSKPLGKVASGGELSRIMLALKVALINADPVPCLVFDEVDTGIGGAVAEQVGRMLKALSARYQVFCVTHLPQIASLGDQHLLVSKRTDGTRTRTRVETLTAARRVDEVARMLGGVAVTETTLAHAREMLTAG